MSTIAPTPISVRRSDDRGPTQRGWLNSKHTFSFGNYYDENYMAFGALRVINEDRVVPGGGFSKHAHENMEIISIVLGGALEHKDSIGTGSIIRPGEVQRMSAGTGIRHSEFNASADEPVHFLQIWIVPETQGLPPSYEQTAFDAESLNGQLRLVGSNDGRDGSVTIHQDVRLYMAHLNTSDHLAHKLNTNRIAWLQVTRGQVELNGETLKAGDGASATSSGLLDIRGTESADLILFDLAANPAF